jgi:hypothetical protein
MATRRLRRCAAQTGHPGRLLVRAAGVRKSSTHAIVLGVVEGIAAEAVKAEPVAGQVAIVADLSARGRRGALAADAVGLDVVALAIAGRRSSVGP